MLVVVLSYLEHNYYHFLVHTVKLSIIVIANKATNTTGNEGPFMQPLVCVRECRYKCRRGHVRVQVGIIKYS